MCDLGLALGIASGVAGAAGEASASRKNSRMIQQETQLKYAAAERERLVETDAALKEGYQAQLEADRVASQVRTSGEGMGGSTADARVAEQARQGALSIANARDRTEAANANYALSTQVTQQGANNTIATQRPNPLTQLTNIATAGISNYGAFK